MPKNKTAWSFIELERSDGMRRVKLMAFLMSLASCLCLFGAGFSSWYAVTIDKGETIPDGNITSYDILTIINEEMTTFQYSILSFKDMVEVTETVGGEQITKAIFQNVDKGVITVEYLIPLETLAATGGNFNVDFSLGYDMLAVDNHKLFSKAFSVTENSYSISVDSNSVNNSKINQDTDTIDFTHSFQNIPTGKDYTFTVTYMFDIPGATQSDALNFKNTFGQYLKGSDTPNNDTTKFVASALVSKVSDGN